MVRADSSKNMEVWKLDANKMPFLQMEAKVKHLMVIISRHAHKKSRHGQ